VALGWAALSAGLSLAFIGATLLGFRYSNPVLRVVYTLSATWLGALSYGIFAALACWLVGGVAQLAGAGALRSAVAPLSFGAALAAVSYGLVNAAWIRVTRITVALRDLPEAWQGRTAALVTDLHLGHVAGPAFLRRVLSRVRALQPDLVLISGDLFDGTPVGLDRLVADLKGFSAARGVFYVTGNHDEFADRGLYLDAVARTGVRVLHNEKVTIEGLQLVGIHDAEAGSPGHLRRILRGAALDPSRPSVLLSHQPTHLAIAEEEGISLQLSGHTHSGQFWPWNLVVRRVWGRFAYGLNRLGRLWVYTSSGVGTWGPPLRVGTKSEVVLIRFEKRRPARSTP
jgi:predicted MPP superfamily phosphohydrolase